MEGATAEMTDHPTRPPARPLAAGVICAALGIGLGSGAGARAQAPAPPPGRVQAHVPDVDDVKADAPDPQPNGRAVNEDNIDQYVFSNGGFNTAPASARDQAGTRLKLVVEDVGRACRLSEAQKEKLRLAGRGDIKRFFDQVEELKRKYRGLANPEVNFQEIYRAAQPLGLAFQGGLFGDGSLFLGTLRKTLEASQVVEYERVLRERRLFRHRTSIDNVITRFDRLLGLTEDQRSRFREILVTATRPSKIVNPYDYYLILIQASKLPEDRLRPIFDDAQWRALGQQLDQVRQAEAILRQWGLIDEEEAPGVASGPAKDG
jgi:hypothetical protein